MLHHLNQVLLHAQAQGNGGGDYLRFCTVGLAALSRRAGGVVATVSAAGHPLPFLVGADGDVRQVGRPGSLLGVVPDASLFEDDVRLVGGDALVLYTDGVIERRSGDSFFGEEGLRATLGASVGAPADAIAGTVEEAVRAHSSSEPTTTWRWWSSGSPGPSATPPRPEAGRAYPPPGSMFWLRRKRFEGS